jgi:hypothetical protein
MFGYSTWLSLADGTEYNRDKVRLLARVRLVMCHQGAEGSHNAFAGEDTKPYTHSYIHTHTHTHHIGGKAQGTNVA